MRGYFAVGAEGISKPMNLGAILRTGHAFGASFSFTVDATHKALKVFNSDTTKSASHVPFYEWDGVDDMRLPAQCQLVGIELTDEAIDMPTFKHPICAAYVFGREYGSLSEEMQASCTHIVKIPTKFCVNVSVACGITLYDRSLSLGGFADRPMMPGGPEIGAVETWKKFGEHR